MYLILLLSVIQNKCLKPQGPPLLKSMFNEKEVSYNFRDPFLLEQPKFNTVRYGYKSLTYMGAKICNSIPVEIKSCTDYKHFKTLFNIWTGPECRCNICTDIRMKIRQR